MYTSTPCNEQAAEGIAVAHVDFAQMSAEQLDLPDASFDAVIDTFGLCSVEHPEAVLREMQRVCKPDGKIILLEHGRGYYDFINSLLDDGAHKYALCLIAFQSYMTVVPCLSHTCSIHHMNVLTCSPTHTSHM